MITRSRTAGARSP